MSAPARLSSAGMPEPVSVKNRFRSRERIQYSRITSHIYIGTNLCCGAHASVLKELGVSVDIDLEYEHADEFEKPRTEVTLFLPTRDRHAPSQAQLRCGVALIDAAVKAKKRVYVHCKNGHGRAPTLVAAYLMTQGMELEEAVRFLKGKRPVVHLNGEQLEALRKFAKSHA